MNTDLLSKAKIAEDSGRFEEAKELYNKILEGEPTNAEALRGRVNLILKHFKGKEDVAYHDLGSVLYREGQYDEAKKNFEKAVALNHSLWQSRYGLANIHLSEKNFIKAREEIRHVLSYESKNREAKALLVLTYYRQAGLLIRVVAPILAVLSLLVPSFMISLLLFLPNVFLISFSYLLFKRLKDRQKTKASFVILPILVITYIASRLFWALV